MIEALIVSADYGGSIAGRQAEVNSLLRSKQPVEIHGTCASACTMYLGLDNVCVSRRSRLGFHSPQLATKGLRMLPDQWERASRLLASHYPASIGKWYIAEGRYSDDLIFISGSEMIRHGVKECGK